MKRFDEELSEIQEFHKQYKQRPKAKREDLILKIKKDEFEAFTTTGLRNQPFLTFPNFLVAPDLTKKKNVSKFVEWDGGVKHMSDFQTKKFVF